MSDIEIPCNCNNTSCEHIALYLKEYCINDIPALLSSLETDDVYKTTLRIPYPYTFNDAKWWIDYVTNQTYEKGIPWNYKIIFNSILIGGIGINAIENNIVEIGYWLDPKYWNKGYMTRCVNIFMKYIIGSNKYGKIKGFLAKIFENNIGSAKVLEKNGFIKNKDIIKNAYEKNGLKFNCFEFNYLLPFN